LGSQTHKKPRPRRKGRRRKVAVGGAQTTLSGGRSIDDLVQRARNLSQNKEFKFAANVTIGVALQASGTDFLADAVIAGAKGYDEALKRGPERGAEKAVTELAKRRITATVADSIAAKAVKTVAGPTVTRFGREVLRDAISSTLEELGSEASGAT
jgi:hypothetical protein